jgi:mRNA interferase MazF
VKRGELYRVAGPRPNDPKRSRVFVVVSRQALIGSRFSTVVCAPVYSVHDGLVTQVSVGPDEGLKHASAIHCDELVSLHKGVLTNFVGSLGWQKLEALRLGLLAALELEPLS